MFSMQNISEQQELKDPAKDPQYSEPQIDAMRAQKDQVKTRHTCRSIHDQPLIEDTLERQRNSCQKQSDKKKSWLWP